MTPLMPVTIIALSSGLACGGDDDPMPAGGTAAGMTSTTDEPATSANDDDTPPATEGGADSTGGGEEEGGSSSSSGGEAIDPNLDRSAPNILDDPDLCGYPGPGDYGYGGFIDQNRFPNFVLEDCYGNQREFAEFFCRRDDDYMDYNHAFIVVFEAVW